MKIYHKPKIIKEFALSHCQAPNLFWMENLQYCKNRFFEIASSKSINDITNFLEVYHHDWSSEVQNRIENLDANLVESDLFEIHKLEEIMQRKIYVEMLKEAFEEIIEKINRPEIVVADLGVKECFIFSGCESIITSNGQVMNYIDLLNSSKIINQLNEERQSLAPQ